jgi:hypothetical protein
MHRPVQAWILDFGISLDFGLWILSFPVGPKARRILGRWRGAGQAPTRSGGLQRARNQACGPKDQRMSLNLKAIWN